MQSFFDISLTLKEWLAITGFAQSVFILVYMSLRVNVWRQAYISFAYFFFLAVFFALQFALKMGEYADQMELLIWLAWSAGPPLSYLLVLQVTDPGHAPPRKSFLILLLIPASVMVALMFASVTQSCDDALLGCGKFLSLLYWASAIAGALSMLAIWTNRQVFAPLRRMRGGHERYWLILSLVMANTGAALLNFLFSTGSLNQAQMDILRALVGILFAYLAMTTLFRVYPLPLSLAAAGRLLPQNLSREDLLLVERVRHMLDAEKVYQEPSYGRAELARELKISESVLSRVINTAFGRTVPQLLGEYRVEDAKRLLLDPAIAVNIVAQEAGFNSLASFNRVFRELTGEAPSQWRERELQSKKS
jgi:AraC-like DNA-binding protein